MYKGFRKIGLLAAILISITVGALSGYSKDISPEVKEDKSVQALKPNFSNISPQDAKKRLDSEKDIILLDVRTNEEYETGHIKGAQLIPVDTLEGEAEVKIKDKEAAKFLFLI